MSIRIAPKESFKIKIVFLQEWANDYFAKFPKINILKCTFENISIYCNIVVIIEVYFIVFHARWEAVKER
ncbi:hypothetical protein NPIL_337341 [Nephila pilipes]|uniref:Uncharacterized protein n=1 Tax=Nephila pilipes TaxID=299642 RepID=A0A8X6PYA7_NEPPI|nr:hypothetical protein NPIL_337341 [Nephila pilipes]